METAAHLDRRRFERVHSVADCRLLDPRTGRFLPGASCDWSPGGARLVVRNARRFEPGQAVALLLPAGEGLGVCAAGQAIHAVVRRCRAVGAAEQEIALEYRAGAAVIAA